MIGKAVLLADPDDPCEPIQILNSQREVFVEGVAGLQFNVAGNLIKYIF